MDLWCIHDIKCYLSEIDQHFYSPLYGLDSSVYLYRAKSQTLKKLSANLANLYRPVASTFNYVKETPLDRPSKAQINELPLYHGVELENIIVVTTQDEALKAVTQLMQYTVLGFDTESKPTFVKGETSTGPHLIQLACESKTFLFPTEYVVAVKELIPVLTSATIKKVGFGLADDKKILFKKFGIHVQNTIELSTQVQKWAGVKQKVGARVAVAMVLKQRLSKNAQQSNWSKFPLSIPQIKYAANDAFCALQIEIKLGSQFKN